MAVDEARLGGVILAGGGGRRLGGVDKSALELDGRTLLDCAVDALVAATEIVVVGTSPTPRGGTARWVSEDPPGGGPVAGLLTGVEALISRPELVCVLAVDMPRVTADTVQRLRLAATGRDGALLTDSDGRRQLAGVLDRRALGDATPARAAWHGLAMHRLLGRLDLAEVTSIDEEARDVDTWQDLTDLAP